MVVKAWRGSWFYVYVMIKVILSELNYTLIISYFITAGIYNNDIPFLKVNHINKSHFVSINCNKIFEK